MNKLTRHVFRLCVRARNLRRPPRSISWMLHLRTTSLPYSSYSKDQGSNFTSLTPSTEHDVILQALSTAKTSNHIFEIVKQYGPLLKIQHSLQAFKMLDSMYRTKSITDVTISKKYEFLQLCKSLTSNIKSLNVNDAVHILKGLSYFGVPSTSIISQSLLQLIRQSLGSLSFHFLLDLDFQLKNFESTPLADALKIAIPIMCEIQLNNKMVDTDDVAELADVLLFLCRRPSNHKAIEMVINALQTKGQNMPCRTAKKILQRLCDLEYLPPGYEDVLLNVQQILTRGMTHQLFFDIRIILDKVVKKVMRHGNKAFYNEEFIDSCAKAVISEDFGFEEGVCVLKSLYLLGHTQIRLIDYLAAKCFENPQVLNKARQKTIMTLVIGLAEADYKPIFWEGMQEMILKNLDRDEYKYKNKPIILDFAISMAVLECYDSELIKRVFNEHFVQQLLAKNKVHTYWKFLLMYQSVKLFYTSYTAVWPPEYVIDAAIKAIGPSIEKSSLLPALEKAMGGSQYVLSDLKSKLGHHIDHVVVMRKGGYPVALNLLPDVPEDEPIMYIEDLQLPAESQVIIVVNLPANAYAPNSHRLKGKWTLLLKTLETQTAHTVIPISSIMWNALTDHEKIPYLMQAIRLKCDSLSASANI